MSNSAGIITAIIGIYCFFQVCSIGMEKDEGGIEGMGFSYPVYFILTYCIPTHAIIFAVGVGALAGVFIGIPVLVLWGVYEALKFFGV